MGAVVVHDVNLEIVVTGGTEGDPSGHRLYRRPTVLLGETIADTVAHDLERERIAQYQA